MSKERLLPFVNLEGNNDERSSGICFIPIHNIAVQLWHDSCDFVKKALEMGRNDPRKIIYAFKMGFALVIVALFIFWTKPPNVAQFSIWAILTVIVMFEFSIGATFIKGFNRGLGTFCAGMLAFPFAELSLLTEKWEKVVIIISFFITGSIASYLKLYPTMAPYEYGYRVFVLTYAILMVAGNRTREYTVAILTRLVLIAVGACICFIINICNHPIWSGDDLHSMVVNNFKELATSLEGCVNVYLKSVDYDRTSSRYLTQASSDQLYLGYKLVIESANPEQTLLGFAIWEPPYGRYRKLHHPWTSYPWRSHVKLSGAVRHCAYTATQEKWQVFRNQLQRVSSQGAKLLCQLGNLIQKMKKLGTDDNILKEVHEAGEQLQKKIDQRWFLLVNSESGEIGNHTKELEDISSDMEHESFKLGVKSLSETAIYSTSPSVMAPRLPNKDLPKQKLRKHAPWPSWISFEGDGLIKEDKVKTYQSTSALSLATFASLLIEFVARLQNAVDCFEKLSEEAEFSDPNDAVLTESAGFWTRFLRCFRFKN
ncbi:putative membrane protein [Handroanthus impetiginosus]|uniref:Putative membrane protein n=1 Tax=Handroanthus impetiginosus TaxID=429701 RepID=A0A2G9G0E7_9LAMI|nr:putative membrane protein [Handroanthus impetiginosus]